VKKVTIRVSRGTQAALKGMGERFVKAGRTGTPTGDTLQFESPAALFRVFTPRRWDLVERLQTLGPSSVRGLARALERDVKRVHEDVHALMQVGLIVRTEEGAFHVPYEVIHADFDLRAVA
jgi:predicted transcriptional regulator